MSFRRPVVSPRIWPRAEEGDANFVRDAFLGKLFFGFADERDLRDGVDAVGIVRAIGMDGNAERVGRGHAALLHGNRAETWEPDDVADSEDVRLLGSVVGIDGDAAAGVGVEACGGEVELLDVALAAHGVE